MKATIEVSTPIVRTPRVVKVESLFDVSPEERSSRRWVANLPIEEQDWNIGLIVGPSGAGKTQIARKIFGDKLAESWDWPTDKSVLDAFPATMPMDDVIGLLVSVGFSTAPSWLRPYHALSNGEQFRCHLARTLAELPELGVVDEFTSVVDRQVAKVASAAVAKTVRRRKQKFVAVTCHYDIEEWLQPDWVYLPATGDFHWRSLQRRPEIRLEVCKVPSSAWAQFRRHHYLSGSLPADVAFWGGFVDDECVAFAAIGTSYGSRDILRIRREVVLPDWQGIGIGSRFEDYLADFYSRRGFRFHSVTGHPGQIRRYLRSPRWKLIAKPPPKLERRSLNGGTHESIRRHQGEPRMLLVHSFAYVPTARMATATPAPDVMAHRRLR